MNDISQMRTVFDKHEPLDIKTMPDSPVKLFEQWFELARHTEHLAEPNAFVLSTANHAGRLRTRTVLLKYFDHHGFVFFTNYHSQKAHDISENPQVSVCFPWYPLQRQLLIEGRAEKISQAESLKYFASRPKESQIGAWVSQQSQVIDSRQLLIDKAKQLAQRFAGKSVPLPDFWGGYRIRPTRFEFWQGQPGRLHDRIQYTTTELDDKVLDDSTIWEKQRLSP
ncbi:pyridoxamine 5'-phosphate oxidase [Ostreibacterium oceani]|uniref:Pyridoxine/pyridoxamine 5'-phosphate oxidase n=1 Tax=Ostreibacterium oceani TaxID=2654998 RepID=A0A6N7EWV4_9GAMM|nr:pyridoxamine 5'-phosphate oxidase [Ostreibacterium oceani]MPV86403.1 pyridoxamine 5'-phosphate oxidase [Ostreibacterium oceani]